jgi:hypothetical protein
MIIVLTFFSYKTYILINKADTSLAKKSFFLNLDEGNVNSEKIGENGFDFAFILSSSFPLNSSYGFIQLS